MNPIETLLEYVDAAHRPKAERLIQQILDDQKSQQEQTTSDLQEARKAALNMMEDALLSKDQLHESRKNLEITLNSIGDAVVSTDTAGQVTLMNPVAERLTGWPQADAAGKPLKDIFRIINETSRQTVENPVAKVMETGHIVGLANHTLLIARDGTETPIADSAAPIQNEAGEISGVVLVFRDQTQERAARNELESSRRLLRDVIDAMPSRVWWKDLNSVFLGCNLHFAHDADLETPNQLIGKTDHDMCWSPEADHFVADDREVIESGTPKLGIQEFQTQIDGKTRWIETNKVPFRDNEGRIIGTVGSYDDITQSKQLEMKLRQTQFAVDHLTDSAYWADDDGRLTYVNQATCTALGYTKEELLKRYVWDVDPGVSPENWPESLNRIKTSGHSLFESTHRRKDGSTFPVEIKVNDLEFEGVHLICGFAHDISNRKRAEKKIRFEQSLLHSVMNTIPTLIYFKDTESRFVFVNQSMADQCQMSKEELIGKSDFDILSEQIARKTRQLEVQVMETEQPVQLEEFTGSQWYFTTKAPRYDENGNITGTFGISWNITGRKNAEKQIQFEQTLFRAFMETLPAAVYFKNCDGQFMRINQNMADAFASTKEEMIGKTDFDFYPEEMARKKFTDELLVMQTRQPIQLEEPHNDRWVMTTKAPLYDETGNLSGTFGISWDITDRKRAEKQIQFEQNLFQSFMDAIPANIYFKDLDGRFVKVNKFGLQGHTEDAIIGRSDIDLIPAEQVEKLRQTELDVMKQERPIQVEEFSNDRWFFTTKAPLYDDAGKLSGIFGISWDITEQKRMKDAVEKRVLALTRPLASGEEIAFDELFDLKEIQRIQDEFASATGVASIITQTDGTPITRPSNFTCLCNNIIRKTELGCANCFKSDAAIGSYHPEGPIVQPCLSGGLWDAGVSITIGNRHIANWLIGQVRDETQTDAAMRDYAKAIGADETKFMDAFYRVPVMSLDHFEKIAQALFSLANQLSATAYQNIQQARFIADEKRRTEELNRLSTAIQNSPQAIMITDPAGIIQYVNPAFETITGYSRDEALGQTPRILKSGQQDPTVYSNLWKTIADGKIWTGRLINRRKDGLLYTEEVEISPVRNPAGHITGYVAGKRDITEELVKEEKFRQSQKMEAVGQLAGGIAHDFNNILQAILGFSDILLSSLDSEGKEYPHVKEIQKSAQRAAELTRQLLTFSRKQPMEKAQIDLNASVEDTGILLQLLLGSHVKYVFTPDPALHAVYADHSQITQIIMNLAVNARDAMPDGGRLTLTTKNITIESNDMSTMPDAEPGTFVCLSMTDTGTGMSREVKDHLFEPFFTTKAVGRGTGLGLAVVYGIVKQNNGWIHVYSEEGHGSSFNIYLPSCGPVAQNPPNLADPPHHKRILLVEDEENMLSMVIRILKTADYETQVVKTAEEALRLFKKEKGTFDLLFSDMTLPGKSGLELADALRAENPTLPVLLYSGYQDQRERWRNLESKGYHFLQKPFTLVALLAAVQDTLNNTRR
jgi:PAS domain S-box-containing protein